MSDHLPLHGETVTLKELRCFAWGKRKGYKVVAEYDGIPFAPFEGFWELDSMLELAGHGKPAYAHSKHIPLPDVQAVIEDVNNSYRVKAVYKLDGASVVTLEDVKAERDKKHAETSQLVETYKANMHLTATQKFALARQRLADKQRAEQEAKPAPTPTIVQKPVKRFAHGEALNAWAKTNPYSLVERNGEYELVIDYAKLAMMKEAS